MADHNIRGPLDPINPARTVPEPGGNGAPDPAPAAVAAAGRPTGRAKSGQPETKDSTREIVETVVFVVVLVLLLKTFVAEAFVIPTGSMATTLLGYQKNVTCPKCGFSFPLNCSEQEEGKQRQLVDHCTCPNCLYDITFPNPNDPPCDTGDRVLVGKALYDTHLTSPKPLDVVVFKFPEEPQEDFVPMNYIKRLIGLPNRTIGIYYGDLYVAEGDLADDEATRQAVTDQEEDKHLPLRRCMHRNQAVQLLTRGDSRFIILRKPPAQILAESRPVYDNDFQAKDLLARGFPVRWAPERDKGPGTPPSVIDYEQKRKWAEQDKAWDSKDHGFVHPTRAAGSGVDWLRYRNVLAPRGTGLQEHDETRPQLITDFMGYNSSRMPQALNWVGDLMLECDVTVENTQADGELRLELSRGVDRFQARIQLTTGTCTLFRIGREGEVSEFKPSRPTPMKKPGTYHVRFANVDERLTLWVDGDLPFGDGQAYDPPKTRGPSAANDLEPASIGVQEAAVGVRKLKLWRDTYYTYHSFPGFQNAPQLDIPSDREFWAEPGRWESKLQDLPAMTMYVQPGHYLCLGDNSPQSSDSRSWCKRSGFQDAQIGGLVPERLLLGRAMVVYYPIGRIRAIK